MACLFALLFVTLHLLSIGEIFPGLAPFRILLILVALSGLLTLPALVSTPVIGRLRTQVLLVLAFFLWVCGSWIIHRWFGGVVATLMNLAPSILAYFIGITQFNKPSRLRILQFSLVLVALFIFAMAVQQIPQAQATGLQTPYVMAGSPEMSATEVRIRGLGMLHDPNYYGQYILILLPLMFLSNKREGGLDLGYFFAVPATLVMMIAIYLTNSRGSQLGLLLLIGFVLWKKFKKVGIFLGLLLAPLAIVLINATRSRSISISGGVDRLELWSDGLGMFKSSPIWGIGYYQFAEHEHLTAHNTYLLCASEMGLIGFFIWMSLIVVSVILLWRVPAAISAADPVLARWAEGLSLSIYGYLFTSFFLSRLYDLPLYLLLGMAGGVISSAGGEQKLSLRGTNWPIWAGGLCVGLIMLIYILVRLRIVR
jgi:O-antigen ligase